MFKRISVLWALVKGDARLLWRALRHPLSPGWLKLGVAGLALYVLSPIDLIPDVIPILGVLDDIVIVPLVIRWLLGRLPANLRADIGAPPHGA
ncbi:MAG: YkvA family protein [Burkholderiaceae bacterium]